MGIFDKLFPSSTRTDVNTTVARAIEDESLPNSIKTGSIKALLKEGNVSEYVSEELVNSIGLKVDRMYSYAERKYIFGLPSGELYAKGQQENVVLETLNRIHGYGVSIEYSHFGPPNVLHIGWTRFLATYGFDVSKNQIDSLTRAKGVPVYLDDLVIVIPSSMLDAISTVGYEQYGVPAKAGVTPTRLFQSELSSVLTHTPVQVSNTATEVHVLLKYVWETERTVTPVGTTTPIVEKVLNTGSEIISVSGFKSNADYFQVKYKHGGKLYTLMYEEGEGSYPLLDTAFTTPLERMGEFYPFAYFRYGKQATNKDKASRTYKDTKKLLNYLNLDFDTVVDAIHENPGVDQVEQAMLILAVSANSTDPLACRYLFDFFNRMYYLLPAQFNFTDELGITTPLSTPSVNGSAMSIKDKQFELALSNGGITKQRKIGKLGSIGTCTTEVISKNQTIDVEMSSSEGGTFTVKQQISVPVHVYRRQVSDNVFDEIHVVDLQLKYFIWGSYTVIGDSTEDILLVPLDRSITKDYSIAERESLYAQGIHFVFNSVVHTEVKWYQTGVFKTFLIIAAVVMTVYTGGSDGGQAIAAAMGLTGAAAVIAVVIIDVVVMGLILRAAFKLFVKTFGEEVANILAVVAIVYGGYQVIKAGGVSGAPWAQTLLDISTGLRQAVLESKMQDLLDEAKKFELYAEEQEKLLEDANKLLDQQTVLSPFVIFGENPSQYYDRTVHSGNIGILGIEAITSFVDSALTLPKLSETIEG